MAEKKKSQQYTCVADSLAEETLKEAADSFFGQRRNIEEALQSYRAKVERLQDIQQEVALSLANLHYLLRQGKPETVRGFYTLIGVDPDKVPSALPNRSPELSHLSVPWALRDKTRYSSLLKQAYAAVVDTASAYMHGRYYNDPENPRCKRVTVNYEQVKQMCAALTAQIEQANQYNSPSQILQFSKKLDTDQAERFLELYGRLLVYVNNRFDVVPEIDSYEGFSTAFLDEIRPIRDRLYHDTDTEAIITEFVTENPAELSESALSQIEEWTAYETGEFAVVEHREGDTVFLDPEQPRAFAVTAVHDPYPEQFPPAELPMPVSDAVLLPFEDTIVSDGWLRPDPILLGAWDMLLDTDLDATDEEARHRYGVAATLPPEDEPDRSEAEKLRFYTKNKENRERFAEEIDRLKNESEELARIYHQQIGKGRARSLGREFREMGLDEAYVAIYDGQVVATAPTESAVRDTLSEIMPDGTTDHPYIYHYDP